MTCCRELSVEILTEHRVTRILEQSKSSLDLDSTQSFVIEHEQGEVHARRVIMATGGRSLPRTGSDGLGWQIVRGLGHTVTSTHPALVPLVLDASMFHAHLSGLSQEVELTTIVDGKPVDRRTGSMLWTHFGISGPVVMDCSRFWTMATAAGRPVEVRCHFRPGMPFEQVDRWLLVQANARPKLAWVVHWLNPCRSVCRGTVPLVRDRPRHSNRPVEARAPPQVSACGDQFPAAGPTGPGMELCRGDGRRGPVG
jgi:predicted flavoprotein YhiN